MPDWLRKISWFVFLWLAGVVSLTIIGMMIKMVLKV